MAARFLEYDAPCVAAKPRRAARAHALRTSFIPDLKVESAARRVKTSKNRRGLHRLRRLQLETDLHDREEPTAHDEEIREIVEGRA